jgi:hypothetical protein
MGGIGSGGGRPGTGPKPAEDLQEARPVEMPADLSDDERGAWEEMAPKALSRGTLTPETAARFRLLCRAIVMERSMATKILADGWTYISVTVDGSGQERETLKAHPLCGAHRGMMQRVEAGMLAFRMSPVGKPIVAAKEKAASALEKLQARRLKAV